MSSQRGGRQKDSLDNVSQPVHKSAAELEGFFGNKLRHPGCTEERYHRSAVRFYKHNCSRQKLKYIHPCCFSRSSNSNAVIIIVLHIPVCSVIASWLFYRHVHTCTLCTCFFKLLSQAAYFFFHLNMPFITYVQYLCYAVNLLYFTGSNSNFYTYLFFSLHECCHPPLAFCC